MSGITAVVNRGSMSGIELAGANEIVAHRGPMMKATCCGANELDLYSGIDTSTSTRQACNYEDINPSV